METSRYESAEANAPIAHTRSDGTSQPLEEHLRNTSELSGRFGSAFGATNWGYACGLLHDDGKATEAFQRRIHLLAAGESAPHVDHSTPGARFAVEMLKVPPGAGKLIAYCVAGHHTGLPDGDSGDDETCLRSRLEKSVRGPGYLASALEALEPLPFLKTGVDLGRLGFSAAFFTRMLFSCLVDADFLDTERFVDHEAANRRGGYPSLSVLKTRLDQHLSKVSREAATTEVNRIRAEVLEDCRRSARLSPGLFSLTVPTGGGKTLSSVAFALEHAVEYGMERIIYVIPYTSIIEQTAAVFREALGNDVVVEHHSNFVTDRMADDDEAEERRRLATENWDAPVIVTTNVQFFESFFGNRSSRTRRLHSVARSVVVLDEAQMLPVEQMRPTIEVIRELALYYRSSVVLCTATQPALTVNDEFKSGLEGVCDLVNEPTLLEIALRRVGEATWILASCSIRLGPASDENRGVWTRWRKLALLLVAVRCGCVCVWNLRGRTSSTIIVVCEASSKGQYMSQCEC